MVSKDREKLKAGLKERDINQANRVRDGVKDRMDRQRTIAQKEGWGVRHDMEISEAGERTLLRDPLAARSK